MRDLNDKQFKAAMARHGWRLELPALGYWKLEGTGRSVSIFNANTHNKRAILAFMIREKTRILKELED